MRFPHLNGRVARLADSLDLPADLAEWIAVTALHSGCFLRKQLQFYGGHHEDNRIQSTRIVRKLNEKKLITQTRIDSLGLLVRITNKSVYRLLDASDIRHRRKASWAITYRRLLSLDYVLEHPELPWLPTESEKVACFDALGIQRSNLPRRVYRGIAAQTVRLFGNKHPIAVDPESKRAVFVYADSDETTPQGVRSWRTEHQALWSALHTQRFALEIVHASFNPRLSDSVSRLFSSWSNAPVTSHGDTAIEAELALVQDAIRSNDDAALQIYGGFNGALRASTALKKQLRKKTAAASFSATCRTWLSERVARASNSPNPHGSHKTIP